MEAQVTGLDKPPVLTIENFVSSLEARLLYEKQVNESAAQNVDVISKMIAALKGIQ